MSIGVPEWLANLAAYSAKAVRSMAGGAKWLPLHALSAPRRRRGHPGRSGLIGDADMSEARAAHFERSPARGSPPHRSEVATALRVAPCDRHGIGFAEQIHMPKRED